jgi:hypothetical protein
MVAEASDKHGDTFITIDVRDGYSFVWIVSDFLQIILITGLLTSGHVIVDKSPPELSPGVDGAFP